MYSIEPGHSAEINLVRQGDIGKHTYTYEKRYTNTALDP